jgi:peptide-methionine (R)-S-oxide reductase
MRLLCGLLCLGFLGAVAGCSRGGGESSAFAAEKKGPDTMSADTKTSGAALPKTNAEWKKVLTPDQYRVLREKGTEAPFSGEYAKCDKEGVYHCAACGAALFKSDTKFDAGCGWPSFWEAIDRSKIETVDDYSHFMHRIEVKCKNCGGHLGHVFDDGPQPTGLRYCINSLSLKLEEKKSDKPVAAKAKP